MTFKPRLADATRKLIKNRPRTVTIDNISDATRLTRAWITDFVNFPHRDHGVDKVETLYFYLTGENVVNDDNQ